MGLGGGCKFVIAPPFQKKGGAPVPLPPPGYEPPQNRIVVNLARNSLPNHQTVQFNLLENCKFEI